MMPKQVLHWRGVKVKDVRGSDFVCRLPATIEISYRGTLLTAILSMEPKKAISFADAINLLSEKWFEELWITRSGNEEWYLKNFVSWISSLGFHIEITGDEFETYLISSQLA